MAKMSQTESVAAIKRENARCMHEWEAYKNIRYAELSVTEQVYACELARIQGERLKKILDKTEGSWQK
jgi:hypothetical protein